MSRKEKNKPIGEIECPLKGCTENALVYRYRARSGDEKLRRHAGRVYCVCEKRHRCEDGEHILEHAKIWGPDEKRAAAPVAPVADAPASEAPAPVKETPKKQASAPVTPKSPAPVTQLETGKAPASRRWGFF